MSAADVKQGECSSVQPLSAKDHAKAAAYSVTVSSFEPDTGVESLLMLGLSHTDSQTAKKRTNWMYRENPSGAAIVCTAKHNASDKRMGLLALCRRQIWTGGGLVQAGILCDLVTDKSHRTLGPAILLMQDALAAAAQMGLDRVYGWPNEKSIVLFKRFPGAERTEITIYRRYFNWSAMFAEKIPRLPAVILGSALKCADLLCAAFCQRVLYRKFFVKHVDSFAPEFDELWSTSRERYDEIGVRDTTFLNWRFGQNSDSEHKIFALFARKSNKPVGYVVYRELTEESVEITDFLSIDSKATERSVLRLFCDHIRRSGTDKISLVFAGNKKTRTNLLFTGFIPVSSRAAINFPLVVSATEKADVYTHITQADHDVG